ncbi:MAG: nucleotide excision repair endonuclease, partial [Eubacteriales bacterium]|nr:nucleotide excision repair endonuclease [Eubacteriales bacterium]
MSSYVYKFIDDTSNIIYIGKSDNLTNRMKQHFSSRGHLPSACYDSVVKVFYSVLPTKCDADILETFLINKYSPKYNTDKMFYQNINRSMYQLPEPEWMQYQFQAAVEPISEEYQLQAVLKNNISILNNSECLQSICP